MKTKPRPAKIQQEIADLQLEMKKRSEKHEVEMRALQEKIQELEWKLSCFEPQDQPQTGTPNMFSESITLSQLDNNFGFSTFQNLPPGKSVVKTPDTAQPHTKPDRSYPKSARGGLENETKPPAMAKKSGSRDSYFKQCLLSKCSRMNESKVVSNFQTSCRPSIDGALLTLQSKFSSDVAKETSRKVAQLMKRGKSNHPDKPSSRENYTKERHVRFVSDKENVEYSNERRRKNSAHDLCKKKPMSRDRFDYPKMLLTPNFRVAKSKETVRDCLTFTLSSSYLAN